MLIFRFEWKRTRNYILIWAAALAVCIFSMTPVYYDMIETAGTLPSGFTQGGFCETLDVSLTLLMEPLGMYSFLTGFFMIAGGVFGMHLGLSLHTGECTENTAEYLYTKPCGRQMIFKGKMLCALVGVCVTGIFYLLASFLTMMLFRPGFPVGEFLLVVGSFVLLTLFFALLGLMVGIFHPNNRSPLLTAGLVVFVEYCITSFSRTVSIRAIGFLSPFSFFSPSEIHDAGAYSWDYMLWYLLLLFAFIILAYKKILKRDIALAV